MINNKTTSNLKISVITIVRNGMPFIEETIKSVLGQSYPTLEYIIIDGGSTDGTVKVIKTYEANISKWISEKDEGIADAFNKGLSFATGEYILYLNSDDAFANPNVLIGMVEKIIEYKYPPLIYGDCDVFDRETNKVLYRAVINFTKKGLRRGQMLPHPSLFTNRRYFEEYGVFDPMFTIAMDYEWLLRGGGKDRIVHIPLLITNVRNGGISTINQGKVISEIILALKKNKQICSIWGELEMQGYFLIRSFMKIILKHMFLYDLFTCLRNKRMSQIYNKLADTKQEQK